MWGLIIGVALGGLLLLVGIGAWREGRISIGEHTLERGQRAFAALVGLAMLAGLGLAGAAVAFAWEIEYGELPVVEHGRVRLIVPRGYSVDDDLSSMMSRGGMHAVAYMGSGDELLLTWPDEASPADAPLLEVVARLKDAAIDYQRWEVTTQDGMARADMEYASPRGQVVACFIAKRSAEGLFHVTAMCSHHGDPTRCRAAIGSVALQ